MVSIKDASGLVAGDLHCYSFGDTRPNHISDSSPPEIMKDLSLQTRLFKGCSPNIAEIFNRVTVPVKNEGAAFGSVHMEELHFRQKIFIHR